MQAGHGQTTVANQSIGQAQCCTLYYRKQNRYYSSPIVHGAHWIVPVVGSSVEVLFSTSPTSIAGEAWMTVANSFLSTE